jgi:hypothetical protein
MIAEASPNGQLVKDFKRIIAAFRVAISDGWAEGVAANVQDQHDLLAEAVAEADKLKNTAPQEQTT